MIDEIKARHAAATPGPWFTRFDTFGNIELCGVGSEEVTLPPFPLPDNYRHEPTPAVIALVHADNYDPCPAFEDMTFIANAWDDVRRMIALIEKLQRPEIVKGDWVLCVDPTGDKHYYGYIEELGVETAKIIQVSGWRKVVLLANCQKVARP